MNDVAAKRPAKLLEVLRVLQLRGAQQPKEKTAREAGVSPSDLSRTLKYARENGLIRSEGSIILDPRKLGFVALGFFTVRFDDERKIPETEKILDGWPEVQEVHHIMQGPSELFLKVWARTTEELDDCKSRLRKIEGVGFVHVAISTHTSKDTHVLPI